MKKIYPLTAIAGILIFVFILLTSGDFKSRYDGGGRDMVEELYFQSVKQNQKLEAIEEDIEKFYKKKEEAVEKYNNYSTYNIGYYNEAKASAAGIIDASARQKPQKF